MGVIFKLAINNLRQQKTKTIIIGLFIAIGMMIVQVGNGFIESVNHGMEKDFRANYTADIIVSAPIPDGVFMDLFGITDLANVMEVKQIPALPDVKATEKIISETSGILQKSNIVQIDLVRIFIMYETAVFEHIAELGTFRSRCSCHITVLLAQYSAVLKPACRCPEDKICRSLYPTSTIVLSLTFAIGIDGILIGNETAVYECHPVSINGYRTCLTDLLSFT